MRKVIPATVAGALVATAATLAAAPASTAATDPAVYGAAVGVTFGPAAGGEMPVALDLPAADPGVRVAQVTFSWRQATVTWGNSYTYRMTVPTPDCVAGAPCHVDAALPTGRMIGGNIGVVISDGSSAIGSTSRPGAVAEPQPTAAVTAPASHSTHWGAVTLAADAAASSADVPLRGVRFYLNPNGKEDQPYLFDDTAPYSVDVPATDIAASTASGTVYAVAEDAQGHLSPWNDTQLRRVQVGPPPLVSWVTPGGDDRPAGDVSDGVLLGWHTELPDTAPANTTSPAASPYIDQVEVLVDGQPWASMDADDNPIWADFKADPRYRSAEYTHRLLAEDGMAAGAHTATLRVTTSYGAVASVHRKLIVTDGLIVSPATMDGRPIPPSGVVVTAGTTHRFGFTATGKVPGSRLAGYDLVFDAGAVIKRFTCTLAAWWNCPDSASPQGSMTMPSNPGTYQLTYAARESQQETEQAYHRQIVVQAASRLTATVSAPRTRRGAPVWIRGHLVRVDTGRGVASMPVTLQWRRAGTRTWSTVATGHTGTGGWVTMRSAHRRSGSYRYRSPGKLGTLAPATSRAVAVSVR